jgi:hypothetical protein
MGSHGRHSKTELVQLERHPVKQSPWLNSRGKKNRDKPGWINVGAIQPHVDLAPYVAMGDDYVDKRMQEMCEACGGYISAGVSAMLVTAAQQLTSARWLYELGMETKDAQLLQQASKLGMDAKSVELAAWGLAKQEAKSRPTKNPLSSIQEEHAKFIEAQAESAAAEAEDTGELDPESLASEDERELGASESDS